MNRDYFNLIILCVPSFATLDTQIRSLCKMKLTVIKRGVAIVHTPTKSIYSKDIWDTAYNEKVEKSWLSTNSMKPKYSRLTTFRGFLPFPDMTEKSREVYERIKREKRNRLLVEEEQTTEGEEVEEGLNFKSKQVAGNVLKLITEGKLQNFDDFEKLCVVLDKKPTSVRDAVGGLLRDMGVKGGLSGLFKGIEKEVQVAEEKKEFLKDAPAIPSGF